MKDLFYLSGIVLNFTVGAFCLSILAKTFEIDPVQSTKDMVNQARQEFQQIDLENDDSIPYPNEQ